MVLENRQLLMIEVVVALFAWSAIAAVFWRPRLDAVDPRRALRAWIAPQMFRVIGMTMLATGVPGPGLDPEFARWVATGDAITAGLAIVAFVALGRPGMLGLVLAAATTIVGAADIVHNLALGMRVNAAEHLASGWFVVALIVPMMLVAHVFAARMLLRRATWARC